MDRDVDIRLFGAFRQFGSDPTISITVHDGSTVGEVRIAIASRLPGENARALLRASVFATDDRVLDDAEPLPTATEVAVLPPVCGG